jgi:HPt (histidine-containing phosphotransfer) domain-containing protein
VEKITSLHEIEKITATNAVAKKELLTVFIEEASLQIIKLKDFLNDGNLPELINTAHKIKSSLLLIGMDAYKPLAERIEQSDATKKITDDVLELIKIYTRAVEELKTELKALH